MRSYPLASLLFIALSLFLSSSCQLNDDPIEIDIDFPVPSAVETTFDGNIDLDNLLNYANQTVPDYITKDNTGANDISDAGATLGRVLFYDKNLSVDNTISCSSCHQQSAGFGDLDLASTGVAGTTGRHSMRLINPRFAVEVRFFWDERANTLEQQTTMPIQDHIEMGFSGADGDPDFSELITKMNDLEYYPELFEFVYGDPTITEDRMQRALAQFVRSIQSFDSRYDQGLSMVNNANAPFPNFTQQENQGKQLYTGPPQFNNQGQRTGGGLGCQVCHSAPEFDIRPNSGNNGVIGVIGGGENDITVTRSPSLRDVLNPAGETNGPFMHNGAFATLNDVINHYNNMPATSNNPELDNRLRPGGNLQRLNITADERAALLAFLGTLTGSNVYVDERWSDPFPE